MSRIRISSPKRSRCYPSKSNSSKDFSTLTQIVEHYINDYRENAQEELRYFKMLDSLDKAIKQAGLALTHDRKRFSHQKRLSKVALNRATVSLLDAKQRIKSCRNFDELIEVVHSTTEKVKGIGKLYVYDTALRLGANLDIYPEKVYLHAGTRTGARALNLDANQKCIDLGDIPRPLRKLEPREIEDVLCIYKDKLSQIAGV